MSQGTKGGIKTSQENEIYLYNSDYLKKNYDKYVRDDFLYAFGAFYCDKVMKIPHLDHILKTECCHRETELKYRHYEFATYMENIISWLDLKLKFINKDLSKSNKKIQDQLFKTSYSQHGTKISLLCNALDSNTGSQEQNNKSSDVANSHEIVTLPDITSSKNEDFPESSTNDRKNEIVMQNTQNDLIFPRITSPKHNFARSSTNNNYKKGIDMINNIQNKIITLPDVVSPKHDTLGNSTNDHKKGSHMINTTQNKIKTLSDATFLKQDVPESSTNDNETDISMENKIITSPKHSSARIKNNGHKKRIDEINSNLVNISSAVDSILTESQSKSTDITGDVKKSTPDNLKNNTNDKIVNEDKLYPAQTSTSSVIGEEISNMCLDTTSKSIRSMRASKQTNRKLNKMSTKLLSTSNSVINSEGESKIKKIEEPSTSNAKRKTNADNNKNSVKALNDSKKPVGKNMYSQNSEGETILHSACAKDELYSAQTSTSSVIGEEISNICLETTSKSVRSTRASKQTNSKIDDSSTKLLKRSNSVTDSERESKIKKIEEPSSSYTERKTNTDNNKNSVHALNESKKQVGKNVHSPNSKEETILHSDCDKDELYSAQTSISSVIGKETSKMCLETTSKSIRSTRASKQTNSKLDNTSTKLLKRLNSVTDSERESKIKKIEEPSSSNTERKTNTDNNKNLVKTLNESKKQVRKNVPSQNSKEETQLHSVCDKDELYSAQTSSTSVIGEEISNMCLETSSKSIKNTLTNKQTNSKLNKMSTKLLKRSNSVTDSERESKIKKIEEPCTSNAERKTNTDNDKSSVKVLNESIKQVTKNMYSRNSKGETKLHSACAKRKLELVTSLLEDGFNPNVKDNAGWTPMHEAVKSGNLDIVKELIKFGAYLNVPGFEYETPLYTAIKYGKFEIAKTILDYGGDANCINMYGDNARCLNKEKLSELLENQIVCKSTQICLANYKLDEIVIALNNVSLKSATVNTFCKQFNIKLVQNILKEKQFAQVTHMIVSKTKNNTCEINLECLTGIANGLFIINENWITDSLDKNELMKCEIYEVNGTTLIPECNGPKISRMSKQKLHPKLFDGINIHVCGSNGWNQFTLEHLKKLVVEFGAKLLKRMPNPEDCPTNIIPYHCRHNDEMLHVSNIILYTMDSNRLIKYNMKHLKAFHISWFMEAIQKYSIL